MSNLAKLREPFPQHQISYLPKGGVKLAYVGHAALTDRLLDTDPAWSWEPLALDQRGLPALDEVGGLWIKLTVCGVTRLGYGDAGQKKGGDAMKERIGDALRNAAMRFGAALDLWHKGDLHVEEEPEQEQPRPRSNAPARAAAEMTPIAPAVSDRIQQIGADMVAAFQSGQELAALKAWRSVTDNDERIHLWAWLQSESKLRAYLKANAEKAAA